MKAGFMTDKEDWVVWNGSLGVLDTVAIGHIEVIDGVRSACLAAPYDMVGPFNLDELMAQGRVAFGACFVMSRVRWQEDQIELRAEGIKKRRAYLFQPDTDADQANREALKLPLEGELTATEIKTAFRRLAKTAHPDAGGSNEDYRRIAEARDALLDQLEDA
jgi:hypothetical protein